MFKEYNERELDESRQHFIDELIRASSTDGGIEMWLSDNGIVDGDRDKIMTILRAFQKAELNSNLQLSCTGHITMYDDHVASVVTETGKEILENLRAMVRDDTDAIKNDTGVNKSVSYSDVVNVKTPVIPVP